jgi:SAM-dependent methyltransferase
VGVEADGRAARAAERICERVIVGDVEALDLAAALDGARFDVVLLLDVLEHLHDPVATLKVVAALLKPGGRMILSVPNVTHAAVRLQLLSGRFQYTDTGLLDRTHLHFFDRQGLEQLLEEAGLAVLDRMRTVAGATETEIPIDPEAVRAETMSAVMSGDDADTYQFVYVVAPSVGRTNPGTPSLGEALQRRAMEAERLRAEAETYVATLQTRVGELERGQTDLAQQESEARERMVELEEELRRRMGELELKHDELRHAKMDVAVKDEQLAALQAELAPIRTKPDPIWVYARHRLGTFTAGRFPTVYRRVKRILDLVRDRRS